MFKNRVESILSSVTCECLGKKFDILVEYDKRIEITNLHLFNEPRVYLQLTYSSPCTKTGEIESWKGGKWYLSEFMTDDEIIKKCYAAFEAAVKHEVMEGFKISGKILFNPHVDYMALLEISDKEIKRS